MDLRRVIEGQCPTCDHPLERRDDCGWCPTCNVGHSVAGETYTLHMEFDTHGTSFGASHSRFTATNGVLRFARPVD